MSEKELESAGREDVNAILSVVEAIVREHLEKGADRNGTKDSQHLEIDPPIQGGASLCCLNTIHQPALPGSIEMSDRYI